jgi:chemotaxis protein MotA
MKFGTGIGIVITLVGIAMGATMEGTNVMVVINVPAILIVLVGTLGASIAACGLEANIRLPKLFIKAFMPDDVDLVGRVNELVSFAEKARRDGLLALDEAVKDITDPFTKKGVQLVVDGTDPDLVYAVLDAENEAMRKRHSQARNPFMQAGALAPTMGIIGTVFGLVNVMNNLNNPSSLGPLIASAFLATLMGVGAANVVFLPMANRLKELSEEELHFREMTLEGILAIQSGDNPRVVAEKLMAYVPPAKRPSEEEQAAAAAAQKQAAGSEPWPRRAGIRSITTRSTRTMSAGSCRATT